MRRKKKKEIKWIQKSRHGLQVALSNKKEMRLSLSWFQVDELSKKLVINTEWGSKSNQHMTVDLIELRDGTI